MPVYTSLTDSLALSTMSERSAAPSLTALEALLAVSVTSELAESFKVCKASTPEFAVSATMSTPLSTTVSAASKASLTCLSKAFALSVAGFDTIGA